MKQKCDDYKLTAVNYYIHHKVLIIIPNPNPNPNP